MSQEADLREIVFQALGQESAIFMSDPSPGTQQTMPVGALEHIGNELVAKLQHLIDRAKSEAIKDFQKNVDSFQYEYDRGKSYVAQLTKDQERLAPLPEQQSEEEIE